MHLKDANLYITENALTSLYLRGQIIISHVQNERDFILSLTITMGISSSLRNNVCMFLQSKHTEYVCTQLSMVQKTYNNKKENDKQ